MIGSVIIRRIRLPVSSLRINCTRRSDYQQLPLLHSNMSTLQPPNEVHQKATQDTLSKLRSMGIKLEWDTREEIAKSEEMKEGGEEEEGKIRFEELMGHIRRISDESFISSLLAGPDNESDDSIDVPFLLGPVPPSHLSLLDFSLKGLGVIDRNLIQNLTIKEKVEEITSSEESKGEPWLVKRLNESRRLTTSSSTTTTTEELKESNKTTRSLEGILSKFKPRIHYEFEFKSDPSIVICVFVGHLLPSSSLLPPSNQTLTPPPPPPSSSSCVAGLVSYRIQS